MHITRLAVRRPVLTFMAVAVLVLFGVRALLQPRVSLYPKVDLPVITISTEHSGAAPELIESDITQPIEEALEAVAGIRSVRSESRSGLSLLFVEFELSRNIDAATQDVREELATIASRLPNSAEAPLVEKLDLGAQPAVRIALTATDANLAQLTQTADEVLKPRFGTIPGVGRVTLVGQRLREIRVWLNADAMQAYQLAVEDISQAIRSANVSSSAVLEASESSLTVQTSGRLGTLEALRSVRIKLPGRDPDLRLSELAHIEDGTEDADSFARLNGRPAVVLSAYARLDANVVDVAKRLRTELKKFQQQNPALATAIVYDQSDFVVESVTGAQSDLLQGGLLVVVVIGVLLASHRSAFVCGAAIAASLLGTIAIVRCLGFTLNTMTMLALTVSSGLIVDDAIVVLENVARLRSRGLNRLNATLQALAELGLAIVATSVAVAVVFVPIALMDDLIGRFFLEFGVTVTVAVAISTIVALTLVPVLTSRVDDVGSAGPLTLLAQRTLWPL